MPPWPRRRSALRKLNLQVRQEVETAILDVDSSSERVKATATAIEQARESLRIETLKYNLGAGVITDVLDAQTALLVTETTYYRGPGGLLHRPGPAQTGSGGESFMSKPVLVLASLLAATITFFGPWQTYGQEKGKEGAQKAKPVPVVAVQKAQVAPISRTLDLTGTATPTRQARLASPGEGPIQNCRVREGDQVKRGERVLTIGRSGAAAAQVTAMAESVKEQAAELNRTKILVQSGAIPGSQLDTARG